MNRRDFIRLCAANVAILSEDLYATAAWQTRNPPTRKIPSDPIILRSTELEVLLDRTDALPCEYRLIASGTTMRGEDFGVPIIATFCHLNPREYRNTRAELSSVQTGTDHADFNLRLKHEERVACSFVLRYIISNQTVFVTLDDIRESEGYELIEIKLPRLATVRESDGTAWLAHGDDGGHLAFLSEANAGRLPSNPFWGDILATLPVVMIGTKSVVCVQEVTAYMDTTELTVVGDVGWRRASLGTTKVHRVNGNHCYNMNTDPGTPNVCGNEKTSNLLIDQQSSCRLDFITPPRGAEKSVCWLDGAELVRKRMPAIPSHYYDDRFFYNIHCDDPRREKPETTFAECERFIRNVALLTQNAPQIVRLTGWQFRGKDTGFPAVDQVNSRLGGYDGLMRLMRNAKMLNCEVTLSDNYDDAYRSSPAWDPAIIARRPDGELWKSRNWSGEDSYVIGPAKYMKAGGVERVSYTCEHYKLQKSIFIDALSYFATRNDWDPAHPASGIKNLRDGWYRVLDEFAKNGVDANSESLRYAFLGKISECWAMPRQRECPFGGTPIPLLPAVYRKSAVWGQSLKSPSEDGSLFNMLFYNACPHLNVSGDTDLREMTDLFYLFMIPWFKFHNRNIVSFDRQGERTMIGLEGNSKIDLDWASKSYSVIVKGKEIARDGSTFCELDKERIALYSLTAKELAAPLPQDWTASHIIAVALSLESLTKLPVKIHGGKVAVFAPARQPVVLYRNKSAAAEKHFSQKEIWN